jgi:enoyl-CoA hydratase/carnithine racemase
LRATKRALWRSLEVGLSQAREEAAIAIDRLAGHPDQEEGARAWLAKRAPRWQPLATVEAQ